jgi:hypothetical protein
MNPKFIVSIGAALALSMAVQVRAQETLTHPITVTGCVQPADAKRVGVATGATGTSGTKAFVLTNALPARDTSARSAGAGGQTASVDTTTSAPSSETETTSASGSSRGPYGSTGPWYSVIGDLDGLRRAIGHRVEISGTLDTAGSIVGTSASVTDGPSGTIHVTTLKMTAASCR